MPQRVKNGHGTVQCHFSKRFSVSGKALVGIREKFSTNRKTLFYAARGLGELRMICPE